MAIVEIPDKTWAISGLSETGGCWFTEEESADALDQVLDASGLFRVYHEVPGTLIQPRPGQVDKSVRMDRLLVPTPKLNSAGWTYGAIGIEIKRSGEKLGPAFNQAIDYVRSSWSLADGGNVCLNVHSVFIWPTPKQSGLIASVMAGQRVGSASTSPWVLLYLQLGEETVLRLEHNGKFEIGKNKSGRRVGSR